MTDIILILIILAIVIAAITKIVIEKRKGVKCIGCPHGQAAIKSSGNNNKCNCNGPK